MNHLIIPKKIKDKYSNKKWDELQLIIRNSDDTTQWELALYFTDYYKYLWLKNRNIAPQLCAEDFLLLVVRDTKAILKQFAGRDDRYFIFTKNFSFMKNSVRTRAEFDLRKSNRTSYHDDVSGEVTSFDFYNNLEVIETLKNQIIEDNVVLRDSYLTILLEFARNNFNINATKKALDVSKKDFIEDLIYISNVVTSPLRALILEKVVG